MFITSMTAEQPFDFASTPGKLPKHVVPQEYAIRITPDVKKLTFTGSETIKLDVRKPTRELVLNALEIEVASASIDGKPVAKSAIKLDPKQETLTITAPDELSVGSHTLALTFSGKINQQGQGLYYAPYTEPGTGEKKVMLGTQFEATDARRMFPCWDEPIFRARFQMTAIVPENFTAVSNMPIEREAKVAGGKELTSRPRLRCRATSTCFAPASSTAIEKRSHGVLHRVFATKAKPRWAATRSIAPRR
jgi:aminopeptidase N